MERPLVKKAQITLELALAFVMVMILFWASAELFFYLNNAMARRQRAYELGYYPSVGTWGGRAGATVVDMEIASGQPVQVTEEALPLLNFFK